ncbi:unnamed protein product [Amaranthus hypochondriacus]
MSFRKRERGAEFSGNPKGAVASNVFFQNSNRHVHPTLRRVGNRGVTRLLWRCGPQEPPSLVDDRYHFLGRRYSWNCTSLFVDGLP